MRIAIDVRASLSRPTGVGAYVLALARRLPALAPDERFVLFSASLRERYPHRQWPPNVELVDRRLPVRALNLAWHRLGWPPMESLAGAPIDVVHSPTPMLVPSRQARKVVTVHDLFFLKNPEMTGAEIRRDYVPLVRDHVRRADAVICVSRFTAGEARRLLELPEENLEVVPNGVDPAYREPAPPEAVEELLTQRRLPRGAILYVGSEEKRKNLVNLAMAYMSLDSRGRRLPPLLLVGPGSSWAQGGSGVGPQIRATGYLTTWEIRLLMAACRMLVLPSLEEGFGLPVAEAMAAGLPVVCSRGSALEEVAGDAACLVNPTDRDSIGRGIARLLDEPEYASDLVARGLEQSQRFDWDEAARRTLDVYRRLSS
jgi:glycosyltransferase involved in cell wall biosynthesis